MNERRLLLCTDMDRTVIPNGIQPEHPNARKCFNYFCEQPQVCLIYVSGRHLNLILQAITNYRLPEPDYIISDVGTKIYRSERQKWIEEPGWGQEIAQDWRGQTQQELKQLFHSLNELQLQELSKQNTHKLSYYLPLHVDQETVIQKMQATLEAHHIAASLIWSVDEPKGIGLLDILPQRASKLHAIEFLHQQLGYTQDEVLFAGDSGNDLIVLGSTIPSVLVANATDAVKKAARQLAVQNGTQQQLYIANSEGLDMGGNYAAGVLEGIWHFAPEFRPVLKQCADHDVS